ncbi:MAG: SphA family protein [Gammaproteobacteria bacterium]
MTRNPRKIPIVAAMLLGASTVAAGEGGYSNYVPGFYGDLALAVEPPDGVSIRNDFYAYSADGSRSVRSGQLEASAEIDLRYDYVTILYKPGVEVLGGQVAFGITPSIGYMDIDARVQAGDTVLGVGDDRLGVGDITLAANLYWSSGKFNYMWANYLVTPTGTYDANETANTGLNYWTFETDVAVTYFNEETGQDYSVVAGYGYNTENDDTDYQTGDEFHIDVVLTQFLSESVGIGVNGFFFRQLSGDSGSGAVLGGFKGEASGFGPALYWLRNVSGKDVAFTFKWLHEFDVKHRLKGDHLFVSFQLSL